MPCPRHLLTFCLILVTNCAAFASGSQEDGSAAPMRDALLGFLPIAIFLLILYFFFRRQIKSPLAKLQQQNIERHLQHMQRMEELLERAVAAIERSNKQGP